MKISLGEDNVNFKPTEVKNTDDLQELVTREGLYAWSPSIYKNNYRENKNFVGSDIVALDFDNGMAIEEAAQVFNEYEHIIGPSRSHRKSKDGVIADRFRVILFLDRTVTDFKEYRQTVYDLMQKYPDADPACKDPARMFYPCTAIFCAGSGKKITPSKPIEKPKAAAIELPEGIYGTLARATLEFMSFGADTNWNNKLFKAAKDFYEQGYSIENATEFLRKATLNYDGDLDDKDLRTIESAYSEDPEHPPRIKKTAFNFKNIKQLMEEKPTMDWLVKDFLTTGGLSVIAGQAKSGKSTIIRQLSVAIAQGGEFLGRDVKQGNVVYLALEEQEPIIYDQFNRLGVKNEDPIIFHAGPVDLERGWNEFVEHIRSEQPALAVIDTFVLFSNIEDQNSYKQVYAALTKYRNLARETGTHIMCIHHQNKNSGQGGSNMSVMGSSAFTGAVDAILLFERSYQRRYISSNQRGGVPFNMQELLFDPATQSYTLGAPSDEF